MLCNWYGHSPVRANAIDLGPGSWGYLYEISVNCDGNPILDAQGNLVLSDTKSPVNRPDPAFVADYGRVSLPKPQQPKHALTVWGWGCSSD